MTDDAPEDRSDETRSGLPELTRKILSLGLGAYFLGEDAVRRVVKDAKLPRDVVNSVVSNASKGKEELFGYVARELSGFLRQMDVQAELSRFASTHKIRVNAEIEFIPRTPPPAEAPPPPEAPAARSAKTPRPSPSKTPSDIGTIPGDVRLTDLDVSFGTRDEPPPES
jgi:hypothetical protein